MRTKLRRRIRDLDAYLHDLGTEVRIRHAGRGDLARAHQLFNKTNQFNVTSRRYGPGEVERFAGSPRHVLKIVEARDRFGELGTVGLYLLEADGDRVLVDSLLLSCRALGRGIETALMNALKLDAARIAPAGRLCARFVPTRKNAPAREFFESQGLPLVRTEEDSSRCYELGTAALRPVPVPYVLTLPGESQ